MQHSDNDSDKRPANQLTQQLSGDLNSRHKSKPLEEEFFNSCQEVREEIQSLRNAPPITHSEEQLAGLINNINILDEQVKKLKEFQVIPYKERYKIANQKVPFCPGLVPDLDEIIRAQYKKFFIAIEKALDNTFITETYPQEATVFKAAILYQLYLDENSPTMGQGENEVQRREARAVRAFVKRLIEMLIAIREADFPDRFKYIEKGPILKEAERMELAEQAYKKICENSDSDTRNCFQTSYEYFKKIYLGLECEQTDLEDIQDNEIHLPEIPDTIPEQSEQSEQSDRKYYNFDGNEINTLKLVIPPHKKDKVFISDQTALDTFMRACLSEQTKVNEYKDTELRKRIAADKFNLKLHEISNDALSTMHSDKTGKVYDANQGYVSDKADPDHIVNEITKIHKSYQEQLIITTDCKLTGRELIKKFFDNVFESLKLNATNELKGKLSSKKFEKIQQDTKDFDIARIEPYLYYSALNDFRESWSEMLKFKGIVTEVGVENIKILNASPVEEVWDFKVFGPELIKEFFDNVFDSLKLKARNELSSNKFEKIQQDIEDFNINRNRIGPYLNCDALKNYVEEWIEIQYVQFLVTKMGAEHIKIFSVPTSSSEKEEKEEFVAAVLDFKLTDPKLIQKYFSGVFNLLKLNLRNELEREFSSKEFKKIQQDTEDFSIDRIGPYLNCDALKNYVEAWIKIQCFQFFVTKVGAEHNKNFSAPPCSSEKNDSVATALVSAPASKKEELDAAVWDFKLIYPGLIQKCFNKVFNLLKLKARNELKEIFNYQKFERIINQPIGSNPIYTSSKDYKKNRIKTEIVQAIVTKLDADIKNPVCKNGRFFMSAAFFVPVKASYSIPNVAEKKEDTTQAFFLRHQGQ